MDIDGKNYNLQKNPKQISLNELTQDANSKIAKLFNVFDNGDKTLTLQELKNAFGIFSGWDKKDKEGKSDNKLTDEEIQQAIKSDSRLKDFSISEVKVFLKSLLNINEKNIQQQEKAKQKQINEQAVKIAKDLYDQISGPSLNKNTVEKLKQITPENAAQVLYEYEELADESLVDALTEEWGFKLNDIIKYVCQPLINQASQLTKKHYSYEILNIDDVNKLVFDMTEAIGYEKQPKEKPDEIAKLLYKQIKGPSFNKNTLKLMRKVTSKNAAQVVLEYQKLAGESLADAIDEEWGLDYETVKKNLVNKLIRQGQSTPNMGWFNYGYADNIFGKHATNTFIDKLTGTILQTIDKNRYIPDKISLKDYTYEKLKVKYPKCTVRQNGNVIQVRNKDGSFRINVTRYEDGHIDIDKQYGPKKIVSGYEKNGEIRFGFVTDSEENFRLTKEDDVTKIVENLIDDLSETKMLFWATTKERIKKDISDISSINVIKVLNEYKKQTGKSLIESIKNGADIDEKDKKDMLNKINNCLAQTFSNITKDITDCGKIKDYQSEYENGILAAFCIDKDFPEASKKALTNKVYQLINEKLKNINPEKMEETYTEKEICFKENSISHIIAKEKALPKSVKEKMLKQVEDKLSQSIEKIDGLDYIWETLGSDYDNTKHPTKVDLILYEDGLPIETRVKLLKQFKDKVFKDYIIACDYDINKVEDISKAIDKEIAYLATNPKDMSGELLDRLFIKLHNRSLWKEYEPSHELKMPNGKIDEISYQGDTGDCWLLASINALAKSVKGLELLNNSIKVNKDNSVTVTLRGVNKKYTFSLKELMDSNELSTGDLDVRALEKAVEKYVMQEKHDDIVGDPMNVAYEILVGNEKNIWKWEFVKDMSDEYIDIINNPDIIVTASTKTTINKKNKSTEGETLVANHAYTVVKADKNYVYLINPWDSGNLIKLAYKDFIDTFENFYDMSLV